jgi:hypothetical protein
MTLRCGGRSRPPGSSSLTITGEERACALENLEGASRRDVPTTMSKPLGPSSSTRCKERTTRRRVREVPYTGVRALLPGVPNQTVDNSCFRTMSAPVRPVAQWLEPAVHNGLVGGSSPPGLTTHNLRECKVAALSERERVFNALGSKLGTLFGLSEPDKGLGRAIGLFISVPKNRISRHFTARGGRLVR